MEIHALRCDGCNTEIAHDDNEKMPKKWTRIPLTMGASSGRDIEIATLHICPKCIDALELSVTGLVSLRYRVGSLWAVRLESRK